MDQFDGYLKGGFEYLLDTGVINLAFVALTIPVVIVGIITTKIRFHNIMGMVFLVWQFLIGFGNIETLAS